MIKCFCIQLQITVMNQTKIPLRDLTAPAGLFQQRYNVK